MSRFILFFQLVCTKHLKCFNDRLGNNNDPLPDECPCSLPHVIIQVKHVWLETLHVINLPSFGNHPLFINCIAFRVISILYVLAVLLYAACRWPIARSLPLAYCTQPAAGLLYAADFYCFHEAVYFYTSFF